MITKLRLFPRFELTTPVVVDTIIPDRIGRPNGEDIFMIIRRMVPVASLVGVGAAVLVGCSSNGSTSASQQDIENKLKKDPEFSKVLDQLPAAAKSKSDVIVTCIAKAIKKDADGDDVDDYVKGDKSLSDIGGDEGDAKNDTSDCVKNALTGK